MRDSEAILAPVPILHLWHSVNKAVEDVAEVVGVGQALFEELDAFPFSYAKSSSLLRSAGLRHDSEIDVRLLQCVVVGVSDEIHPVKITDTVFH